MATFVFIIGFLLVVSILLKLSRNAGAGSAPGGEEEPPRKESVAPEVTLLALLALGQGLRAFNKKFPEMDYAQFRNGEWEKKKSR